MTRLSLLILLLLASPACAVLSWPKITIEVENVSRVSGNLFEISDGHQAFQVQAPGASVLPDLQNLDAFSETWFCTLEDTGTGYGFIGCTNIPPRPGQ